MTVIDALVDARLTISHPTHWTQEHSFITNDAGDVIAVCATGAVNLCLTRARRPFSIYEEEGDYAGAIAYLRRAIGDVHPEWLAHFDDASLIGDSAFVALFNDTHTHVDVLRLFDCAIACAQAAQELVTV